MKLYDAIETHKDERGVIVDILTREANIKSVLYITGKKGTVRGNHYHMKDSHYCFVVSGKIRYFYKDILP